ncbi:hypothetical protein DXA14_09865 [Hungatella hathewayi]|nr:hypothetical protein DXA14_09865 [Hungatella hathewayi]
MGTINVLGTFMPGSENEVCHWGCYLVYDYLFYYDEENNAFSDILKNWYYEEDGTTFVMECRDDVYFANGNQMTGEDVLFSIKTLVDRGTNQAAYYATVDWDNSYVSEDGFTVYLANTQEFGPGIINMGVVYLLDQSWCEETGFDNIDPWLNAPNGSGPYEVAEYVTDSYVTLKRVIITGVIFQVQTQLKSIIMRKTPPCIWLWRPEKSIWRLTSQKVITAVR